MKIKAFGMDIQVTESAVFVNGKEVHNKMEQEFGDNDRPIVVPKLDLSEMFDYSESFYNLIKPKDENDKEQRMNVIGQNGNDGLHYGFWEDMNNDLMDNNRNEGVWDTDN